MHAGLSSKLYSNAVWQPSKFMLDISSRRLFSVSSESSESLPEPKKGQMSYTSPLHDVIECVRCGLTGRLLSYFRAVMCKARLNGSKPHRQRVYCVLIALQIRSHFRDRRDTRKFRRLPRPRRPVGAFISFLCVSGCCPLDFWTM